MNRNLKSTLKGVQVYKILKQWGKTAEPVGLEYLDKIITWYEIQVLLLSRIMMPRTNPTSKRSAADNKN